MSTPKTAADSAPTDARRRRLLYRATHRGTHETALLVGGFVAARISTFDPADLDALEEILELPDPVLADWLTGRATVPAEVDSPLLRAMCAAATSESSLPGLTRQSASIGTIPRSEADGRVKPGHDADRSGAG